VTRNSSERSPGRRRIAPWWPIVLALLGVAVLYGTTLREGHAWGGDNAMYLLHARNIVTGQDYAETGYLYNEASARLPQSYPPIFPLLLAPWATASEVDWAPMKLLTVACLIAALGFLAGAERPQSGRMEGAALVALVGLNPIFWDFKDNVLSEFPFLMFLCVALWAAQRSRLQGETNPRDNRWGLLLGVLIYLAYGTRSVGALVLPALAAADLLGEGKLERRTWLAALVFVPMAVAQNLAFHSEAGHLIYKLSNLRSMLPLENLFVHYPKLFLDFWRSAPPMELLGVTVAIVAFLALAIGLAGRARRRELDVLDWYVLLSLAFYLLIRLHDTSPPQRYWIPLFPLFAVQVLRGIRSIERKPISWGRPLLVPALVGGFCALALFAYGLQAATLERNSITQSITGPDAKELYEFVRGKTLPDDTLIFFEPRVLALYTGRTTSEFRVGGDREEWMRYAESINARYWVRPGGLPESYRDSLSMVFANDTFSVFRFNRYR
jgi:hypothetical protein